MAETGSEVTEHDLLTVIEVADLLRISKSKVYELLHSKQLRGVKLGNGRKWLVHKRSIAELLDPVVAPEHPERIHRVPVVPTLAGLRQMVEGKR